MAYNVTVRPAKGERLQVGDPLSLLSLLMPAIQGNSIRASFDGHARGRAGTGRSIQHGFVRSPLLDFGKPMAVLS
jgi:hypothetical protein